MISERVAFVKAGGNFKTIANFRLKDFQSMFFWSGGNVGFCLVFVIKSLVKLFQDGVSVVISQGGNLGNNDMPIVEVLGEERVDIDVVWLAHAVIVECNVMDGCMVGIKRLHSTLRATPNIRK